MEDMLEIAFSIKECKNFFLQQFEMIKDFPQIKPHSTKFLEKVKNEVGKIIPCQIRGL